VLCCQAGIASPPLGVQQCHQPVVRVAAVVGRLRVCVSVIHTSFHNIVPAATGADHDLGLVIPELAGRLQSVAIRVPVPAGSLTDLTCQLAVPVNEEQVNAAFESAAARGPLSNVLGFTRAPIVSSDVLGDSRSCVLSAVDTAVHAGQVKVYGWYDNEWAYANRLLEVAELVAGVA
jgi:glyceraldehyde 3-phosphate dehydrogenase